MVGHFLHVFPKKDRSCAGSCQVGPGRVGHRAATSEWKWWVIGTGGRHGQATKQKAHMKDMQCRLSQIAQGIRVTLDAMIRPSRRYL